MIHVTKQHNNYYIIIIRPLQSYTTGSGASPYSLSPMDEVAALPSPTGGVVSTVAQVSSSATAEGAGAAMMQAAVSTSL